MSQFTYLGIIFKTGGSFKQTFDSLHGQSLKSIFKLKSVLNKFPCITEIQHYNIINIIIGICFPFNYIISTVKS